MQDAFGQRSLALNPKKETAMAANSLIGEMFHVGLYKPTQGRVTRQVTCGALWLAFVVAAYSGYMALIGSNPVARIGIPAAVVAVGFWTGYRLVNFPRFADFLIAVEAEMSKVSWPSKAELIRSSMVVIFVMFALAGVLLGFDALWRSLFSFLQIVR